MLAAVALVGACDGAERQRPFDYDDRASLDVRTSGSYRVNDVRVSTLTYKSPKDGRVPALLFVPSGEAPRAGLIVQHGLPSRKEDVAHDAAELASLGAVVIAIDAPFARPNAGEPVEFTLRDREEQVQLIVDLRRAVDLLRSRADVDPDRIGYLGISYGGAMGGLLAGVEHRIAAFVLMVGDGGLVEHFSGPEDRGGPLSPLEPRRRKEWIAAMRPIEPLTWIKRASERTSPLSFRTAGSTRAAARCSALPARGSGPEADPLVRLGPLPAATRMVRCRPLPRRACGYRRRPASELLSAIVSAPRRDPASRETSGCGDPGPPEANRLARFLGDGDISRSPASPHRASKTPPIPSSTISVMASMKSVSRAQIRFRGRSAML